MNIFWSWQSDTHQPTGRYFVRDVLRTVAASLNNADGIDDANRDESGEALSSAEIALDYDTSGVSGSPPIAETILEKIVNAGVFVADVTPVAVTASGKKVPNPNVMVELGYALRALGHKRILLVMNEAHGAELAALPFDLRHWRQPIAFDLSAHADSKRKEDVAKRLKSCLKSALRPALEFAIKEERDKSRVTHRGPVLAISVEKDLGEPLPIEQRIEKLDAKSVDEIKAETPLLPLPPSSRTLDGLKPYSPRMMNKFGMISRSRPVEQWSREEVEGYNKSVIAYYQAYQDYLAKLEQYELLRQRTFRVKLVLTNDGTAPATDIDAVISFPETVAIHELEKFPDPPTVPQPPALRPINSAFAYITSSPSRLINSPVLAHFSNTRVRPAERQVDFTEAALKHHASVAMDEFIVSFANTTDIASFEAHYVITANEPIDPVRGVVRFDIESLEATAATPTWGRSATTNDDS